MQLQKKFVRVLRSVKQQSDFGYRCGVPVERKIRAQLLQHSVGAQIVVAAGKHGFRGVIADGVLPRKTFSMGHSREKRYYLEGRKIKA